MVTETLSEQVERRKKKLAQLPIKSPAPHWTNPPPEGEEYGPPNPNPKPQITGSGSLNPDGSMDTGKSLPDGPEQYGSIDLVDPRLPSKAAATEAGGSTADAVIGTAATVANSLLPGLGGIIGGVGGALNSLFGGNELNRHEDPYTIEGAKMLRAIEQDDPEARRRQRDSSLATQQGAAVQNALNASTSQNANAGNGGDIQAGNIGTIRNSTAAIGAAGQFAEARQASDSQASTEQHDIINQKREIATSLADRAKDINLINEQKTNFGSQLGSSLLGGLAGFSSGVGIVSELENAITGKKKTIKSYDPVTGKPIY